MPSVLCNLAPYVLRLTPLPSPFHHSSLFLLRASYCLLFPLCRTRELLTLSVVRGSLHADQTITIRLGDRNSAAVGKVCCDSRRKESAGTCP